jgi:hypothetical protein
MVLYLYLNGITSVSINFTIAYILHPAIGDHYRNIIFNHLNVHCRKDCLKQSTRIGTHADVTHIRTNIVSNILLQSSP